MGEEGADLLGLAGTARNASGLKDPHVLFPANEDAQTNYEVSPIEFDPLQRHLQPARYSPTMRDQHLAVNF